MSESKVNRDNEETKIQEKFNPAAPMSKKKADFIKNIGRVSAGVGGFVAGTAVGFGVSSMAAGGHTNPDIKGLAPDSTLSEAATPEAELTGVEPDSTISARERTTIDDPYEKPNRLFDNAPTDNHPAEVAEVKVESPVSRQGSHVSAESHSHVAPDGHQSQIISDDNHVIGGPGAHGPSHSQATEVTVVTGGDNTTVSVDVPGDDVVEVSLTTPAEMDAMLVNEHGVPVAHVDDGLSFAAAFAAAREQVGPGGVFEWHGNLYGTFYEEEWDGMSNHQRSDFMARVTFPTEPQVPEEEPFDFEVTNLTATQDSEGNTIYVASGELNGHQIVLLDENGDGLFDNAYVDVDNDNGFDPEIDAVIPIGDAGLTVTDVYEYLSHQGLIDSVEMPLDNYTVDMPVDPGDDLAMSDFDNDSIPDF